MFGVVHNYADELSSSVHVAHLCSVLYTIMTMDVEFCFSSSRLFIHCNVLIHVSVRHNAPALWMSSLHQGSLFPRARSHMYIY